MVGCLGYYLGSRYPHYYESTQLRNRYNLPVRAQNLFMLIMWLNISNTCWEHAHFIIYDIRQIPNVDL